MNRTAKILCLGLLGLQAASPAIAASTPITCPAAANRDTGPTTQPLTNVALWESPIREAIDSAAPPALVPDTTTQTGHTLSATWRLTTTTGWRDYLVCQYGAASHLILFDVTGLATCTETIAPYPGPGPTLAASTFTAACR